MAKQLLPFVFLIIFSWQVVAQKPHNQSRSKVHVTGKVVEKESNQGLEYATLVFRPLQGKRLSGGISDSKGFFDIEVPKGAYTISVEFLSFKTKTLHNQKIIKNTNLGVITLEADMETLDEVEIIAEKSTVEIKLDKKIYNVGKDMTVKGGNASDVLDNVPSVTVDVEGNVSLRGNESVRILVDGKPSGLVGLSSTDALRQLPAEAIQKVEVITSPSARYDAEGTAGIINIILRKSKATGFNAATTLSTGIPDNHGISANVNYRAKKFNVFTNLGYSYRNAPGNALFDNYYNDTGITFNEEKRNYNRKRNSFSSNLGLEYYLSKNASVTGSFLYRNSLGETDIENNSYKYDESGAFLSESFRNEFEDEKDNIVEYALNFTQNLKGSGHKLSFDVKFQDSYEDENSLIYDNHIQSEDVESLEDEKRILLKSDYVLPIGENQQFEVGFQSNIVETRNKYEVDFPEEEDIANIFDYKENIHAIYSQYGNKLGKFSALVGLRAELSDITALVAGTDIDYKKNYTKLFPTLNLAYELSESESLTLGYNRRIRRPRSRHLNPFSSRSSTSNIFKGNPDLNPMFTDGVDLGYLKKWDKLTFNTSIYYKHTENAFQFVREATGEVNENGVQIIESTPINLNDEDRYGLEFSLNYKPAKWLRLRNTFNFYRYTRDGIYHDVDYSTTNESWMNRFSSRIRLFKEVDFQTTLFYRGPRESAVSKREGMMMVNIALSKDVLKDKGTLSFNISDLLNSRKRVMETYYSDFTNYSEFQWRQRQFKLSFTYRFNQKKKRGGQRNGGEENGDDFGA